MTLHRLIRDLEIIGSKGAEMTLEESNYRSTVAELQELAKRGRYVTQEWVLEVASMAPEDMRRRLIVNYDWHSHFSHCLDGIEAIRKMPGAAPDGCWSHREVRSVVDSLSRQIEQLKARQKKSRRESCRDALRALLPNHRINKLDEEAVLESLIYKAAEFRAALAPFDRNEKE